MSILDGIVRCPGRGGAASRELGPEPATALRRRTGGDDDREIRDLLGRFEARTGVGVLLNTSMNLKDEPICNTPAEAYGTFLRSDLDFLVLEDVLVTKEAA